MCARARAGLVSGLGCVYNWNCIYTVLILRNVAVLLLRTSCAMLSALHFRVVPGGSCVSVDRGLRVFGACVKLSINQGAPLRTSHTRRARAHTHTHKFIGDGVWCGGGGGAEGTKRPTSVSLLSACFTAQQLRLSVGWKWWIPSPIGRISILLTSLPPSTVCTWTYTYILQVHRLILAVYAYMVHTYLHLKIS